ncbi:hypothetical protein QTP88_013642 [Uroleucon formosanum]
MNGGRDVRGGSGSTKSDEDEGDEDEEEECTVDDDDDDDDLQSVSSIEGSNHSLLSVFVATTSPPIRPHYTLNPYTVPSRVPPIDEPCRRRKRNGRIVVVVIVVNGTPSIVSPAAVCVPEIIAAATVRMKTDFNHLFQSIYIHAEQIKYYYTSEECTVYQQHGKDDCSYSNSEQIGGDHFIRFWIKLSSDRENAGLKVAGAVVCSPLTTLYSSVGGGGMQKSGAVLSRGNRIINPWRRSRAGGRSKLTLAACQLATVTAVAPAEEDDCPDSIQPR